MHSILRLLTMNIFLVNNINMSKPLNAKKHHVFLVKESKISLVDQNRNMHVSYEKISKVELHPP